MSEKLQQELERQQDVLQDVLHDTVILQDREYEMIKQKYPQGLNTIVSEVEDVCDQLEYEGSPMFDAVLDTATIHRLVDGIYQKQDVEEEQTISCMAWKGRDAKPPCRGGHCTAPYVPDCDHGNCMLRQLIEIMLLNEMHNRRNRYRCRHCRW